MTLLDQFLTSYLGGSGVGNTDENKGQCVGLIEVWLDLLRTPHIWGNARDLLADAPQPPYVVTKNDPTNYPDAGDIVVWGPSWGEGYGHCGICIAANKMWLSVFEQNNPTGSRCVINTRGYGGVIGWIKPPMQGA